MKWRAGRVSGHGILKNSDSVWSKELRIIVDRFISQIKCTGQQMKTKESRNTFPIWHI